MSTISIELEFITGQKSACKVIFTPQDGFWIDGDFIVLPMARHVRTNSDGLSTIVLLTGNYLLTFEGLGNDGAAGIPVSIPNDNLTYKLKDRLNAPPVPPVQSVPGYIPANGAYYGITDLSGGGPTNLDGLTTLGRGSLLIYVDSAAYEYGLWEKIASTHVTDVGNGYLRPLDYDAGTNAFVWKRRS